MASLERLDIIAHLYLNVNTFFEVFLGFFHSFLLYEPVPAFDNCSFVLYPELLQKCYMEAFGIRPFSSVLPSHISTLLPPFLCLFEGVRKSFFKKVSGIF